MNIKNIIEMHFDIDVDSINLIGEGHDSKAYLVNNEYIFKIKFSANKKRGYEKEKAIYDFLNKYLTSDIKIPEIDYSYITDELSIIGYKKIDGKFLNPQIYNTMTFEQKSDLKKDIAEFLKAMHGLDYSK